MKIKLGDKVYVAVGKDKGKTSKVVKSLPKRNKVIVEDTNMVKKRSKPTKQGEKGKVVDTPMPMNVSKLRLVCGSCKKPTRVGFDMKDGKKTRVCRKCGKKT